MNKINLQNIPPVERIPGYFGRFIHSKNMTVAFWEVQAGAPIREHNHFNEQVMTVTEGEFELTINGATHILKAGDTFIIPSLVMHSGRAITPCRIIDIFNPVREDYL
jgi:quercetin dioxygenase-like cupin family protein